MLTTCQTWSSQASPPPSPTHHSTCYSSWTQRFWPSKCQLLWVLQWHLASSTSESLQSLHSSACLQSAHICLSAAAVKAIIVIAVCKHLQPAGLLHCRSAAGQLLEVELELATPDMVWKPELTGSTKGSLQALVHSWLMSFLEVCCLQLAA